MSDETKVQLHCPVCGKKDAIKINIVVVDVLDKDTYEVASTDAKADEWKCQSCSTHFYF